MKNQQGIVAFLVIASLMVGFLTSYGFFPRTVVELQEKACPVCEVCPDLVPEVVYINNTEIKEVNGIDSTLDKAVKEFLSELEEDFDKYEEITKYTVSDDYQIVIGEDTIEVIFEIKVKATDTLTESRETETYNVSVLYEEDEDAVVTY